MHLTSQSDTSRQSPSEPLTGPTPSATSAEAWGMKRGWIEVVAPCYTCLPNIAALWQYWQYCKVAIPSCLILNMRSADCSAVLALPARNLLPQTRSGRHVLEDAVLATHGKEDCKTEENTYLPCTGTPSHAGTAGELTFHVAARYPKLTWWFLTPRRLAACCRVQKMYMHTVPWASAYSYAK